MKSRTPPPPQSMGAAQPQGLGAPSAPRPTYAQRVDLARSRNAAQRALMMPQGQGGGKSAMQPGMGGRGAKSMMQPQQAMQIAQMMGKQMQPGQQMQRPAMPPGKAQMMGREGGFRGMIDQVRQKQMMPQSQPMMPPGQAKIPQNPALMAQMLRNKQVM